MIGWKTGIPSLDDPFIMGGIPKKEGIITFGGPPNHGKSSILINILKGLLLSDNKDLAVLLWQLDDSRNIGWLKILSSMMNLSTLDVLRPTDRIFNDPELKKNYNQWIEFIKNCVRSNKLIVKGHEIGNDLQSAEYWLKYVQDTTGKNVVLFVDAAHDMVTGNPGQDADERIKFARVYDWFQKTTELLNYTVLTCAHVTKGGISRGRPHQNDLSETGKILFASKFIGMVYSELDYLKSLGEGSYGEMYWVDEDDDYSPDNRKPIVEVSITKNKIVGYKGTLYFRHKADACYMEEITSAEVMDIKNKNKKQRPVPITSYNTANDEVALMAENE
jgi:hypothetical protein